MNIDLSKLIPQPNLQNLFDASVQPLKENSTVVHAVSVPTVCQMCPLRGSRPNCSQCNRFL